MLSKIQSVPGVARTNMHGQQCIAYIDKVDVLATM